MSADNWTTCPRCRAEAEAEKMRLCQEAIDQYGKLPVEEYLALRDKAMAPLKVEETLREDGTRAYIYSDNTFNLDYRASCKECGFLFTKTISEPLQLTKS